LAPDPQAAGRGGFVPDQHQTRQFGDPRGFDAAVLLRGHLGARDHAPAHSQIQKLKRSLRLGQAATKA
jgi:hypothetical protein